MLLHRKSNLLKLHRVTSRSLNSHLFVLRKTLSGKWKKSF